MGKKVVYRNVTKDLLKRGYYGLPGRIYQKGRAKGLYRIKFSPLTIVKQKKSALKKVLR